MKANCTGCSLLPTFGRSTDAASLPKKNCRHPMWHASCNIGISMSTHTNAKRTATTSNPLTMLRWEFTRGEEHLICQVDRDPRSGAFAVGVLMVSDLQRASFEVFHRAAAALRRHARLAADLRASGWKLAAYTR